MNEEKITEVVKQIYNKTIAADINPVKYENMPDKLAEILTKCLKKNVTVGIGLDGKNMIINIEK